MAEAHPWIDPVPFLMGIQEGLKCLRCWRLIRRTLAQQELHFLTQTAPDNQIIAIQSQHQGFPHKDLGSDIVIN